jgi:hypothetical protein
MHQGARQLYDHLALIAVDVARFAKSGIYAVVPALLEVSEYPTDWRFCRG